MKKIWFTIWTLTILVISFYTRMWRLERFNNLVFDEGFYAKFGSNFLRNIPHFFTHPPASQYIIALGIFIGENLPFSQNIKNGFTGAILSPWSYRLGNAFTGSLVPLLVILLTYQLSRRHYFALLSGLFTTLDGLYLVESRYASNNIFIIFYGLIGHWGFLQALDCENTKRWLALIIAGAGFGASLCSKWNGLWLIVGAYGLWMAAWIIRYFQADEPQENRPLKYYLPAFVSPSIARYKKEMKSLLTPIHKMTQFNYLHMGFLGIVTLVFYSLLWIPQLRLDSTFGFIDVHKETYAFHAMHPESYHPQCRKWYEWPLVPKPHGYVHRLTFSPSEESDTYGPYLKYNPKKVHSNVFNMGNPFLWWIGFAVIVFISGIIIVKIIFPAIKDNRLFIARNLDTDTFICLYIFINYFANLLCWISIRRCTFIYHYISSLVFKFIALAWFVDLCLVSQNRWLRILGITIILIVICSFLYWQPLYYGTPILSEDYFSRFWFQSWL
jgi:dolichyl-phosphate-mannose-protein mannosyltransferase